MAVEYDGLLNRKLLDLFALFYEKFGNRSFFIGAHFLIAKRCSFKADWCPHLWTAEEEKGIRENVW